MPKLILKMGKKLFINASNNSADNRFVQSVTYNGKAYTKIILIILICQMAE
jgi:putative alpha-1,2-mannosidase